MASTTNPANGHQAVAIAPIEGHRTFTAAADGTRTCECGYRGTAAGLASHQDLARMGIQVGPTGGLLNNAAGARVAPVVDYATLALRSELETLRRRVEDLQTDLGLVQDAADRSRHAATKAATDLEAVRRARYEEQLQAQANAIELGRLRGEAESLRRDNDELRAVNAALRGEVEPLRVVADAAYAWVVANTRTEIADSKANLCDAVHNHIAIPATCTEYAPATADEAAELAAPFGAPISAEDFFSDCEREWQREDEQLDSAGANPAGAVL